jgi:hypothetical protein
MRWKSWAKEVIGRIYHPRLIAGVRKILGASPEDLRKTSFVAEVVREIGLRGDRRRPYGPDNVHANRFGPGLWQIPDQLARALVYLSTQSVGSVLEVGTCDGWTSSVMAAYLSRFQHGLRFVTVDIAGRFTAHPRVNALVPIAYHGESSAEDFTSEQFDLVFIDGNHDYEWVARDYDLVGRSARLCMFHDIDDRMVGVDNVPKFWQDLRQQEQSGAEFQEFLGPAGVMGIGIRKRKEEG